MAGETPDKYYDQLAEREERNSAWHIVLRYVSSVIIFLTLIVVALSTYWVWEDYADAGLSAITWKNFKAHAVFRWQEFQRGSLGL